MAGVTIKDVAKEAGVAISTVSKYLNGGNVLEENRTAIAQAIEKLGYRVNHNAQAMRSGSTRTVMIMVPDLLNKYCCLLAKSARDELIGSGYASLIVESDYSARKEQETLRLAVDKHIDGIICMSCDTSLPIYDEIRRKNIPLVFVGRKKDKKSSTICFDDHDKTKQLAELLVRNGHTRMGVIAGAYEHNRLKTWDFRYYLSLLQHSGLIIDDKYLFSSMDDPYTGSMDAVNYFLRLPEPPTVLLCMSSELTIGAYVALQDRGIRVPEDISLCAVAGTENITNPLFDRFTTISLPIVEAAERAARLLLIHIRDVNNDVQPTHATMRIRCSLHHGTTTGAAAAAPKKG